MDKLEALSALWLQTTPGVWGPTTNAAKNEGYVPDSDDERGFFYVKDGERGAPSWGAVVSDSDGREGIDHERYETEDTEAGEYLSRYYEPGTDLYGGTMVCESLRDGNGEFIAAAKNSMPGLLKTIAALRALLLEDGFRAVVVDKIIEEKMNG